MILKMLPHVEWYHGRFVTVKWKTIQMTYPQEDHSVLALLLVK